MNSQYNEGETTSRKIFCISMQRCGTNSVGNWLQSHGLRRAGFPTSHKHQWTRLWMAGDFEAIFRSSAFQQADIFEDDPWWCPEFHRFLAHRFPDALFIFLERDPQAWFRSLCSHSTGRNPGATDIHCRIYRREDELEQLRQSGVNVRAPNLLDIVDHAEFYKKAYLRHTHSVIDCFRSMPQRLFHGSLDDPDVFPRMRDFVGIASNPAISVPHNATVPAKWQALAAYMTRKNTVLSI